MSLKQDLKYRFARLNIAEKIIAVNVVLFILPYLIRTILFLFKAPTGSFLSWVELHRDITQLLYKPWTLVTYGFFHAGLWHILFNMIMLFFASRIFLNLFNGRRFLNVYFLGIIAGGLAFLLSYNVFPAFLTKQSMLIGSSAGVMAVLIFVCTYIPNQEVRLIFFNLKLWWIGAFFVVMDLIQIPVSNAGGHIAHLGGALLGYMYARQLSKGNDIGEGFAKLVDRITNIFKPRTKSPLKTVHKKAPKAKATSNVSMKDIQQKKIDDILDKISKSGYESLTKEEKDFLFRAGKDN